MKSLEAFEREIGVTLKNKALLRRALTHSSFHEGTERLDCYERQEFLGDSVLGLVIGDYLFQHCPNRDEGVLTKIRASIVCEPSLARIARKFHIGEYLYLGHGEEQTGGRERDSILSDVVEAVIAAIYLDCGFETAKQWVLEHFADLIDDGIHGRLIRDYKTKLQEWMQHQDRNGLEYQLLEESGPAHMRRFTVAATEHGKVLGTGSGGSKKEAEQNAAKAALIALHVQ